MSGPAAGSAASRELARERAFDPEMTQAMRIAFAAAQWVLGGDLSSRSANRLARSIVEVATTGENDPWRLRATVFRRLRCVDTL